LSEAAASLHDVHCGSTSKEETDEAELSSENLWKKSARFGKSRLNLLRDQVGGVNQHAPTDSERHHGGSPHSTFAGGGGTSNRLPINTGCESILGRKAIVCARRIERQSPGGIEPCD
jgi:hypothetical protein